MLDSPETACLLKHCVNSLEGVCRSQKKTLVNCSLHCMWTSDIFIR